jgi:hypothetical protein
LYWYLSNGKLDFYSSYDIIGHKFYSYRYNQAEHGLQMNWMISPLIYSIDAKDSVILLYNNNIIHNIKDLYLTVATPPGLNPKFNISVNNIPISNYRITNNTIIIKNVFNSKGSFLIYFYSEFLDNNRKIVRSPRFQCTIIKD